MPQGLIQVLLTVRWGISSKQPARPLVWISALVAHIFFAAGVADSKQLLIFGRKNLNL
jgi:hypothetical protein